MNIKSFLKGTGFLLISNVLLKAINFFLLPLYTSYLTPEMIGISDSITTFTGLLLPLFVFGLDSAFSAFYNDKTENQALKVYNTLSFSFFILGLLPIALIAFSGQLSAILFQSNAFQSIVAVSLISITFGIWQLPFALNLRMKNKMLLYSIVNVLSSLVLVLLNMLFVVYLELGAMSLILSAMLTGLFQLIFFAVLNHTKVQRKFFEKHLLSKMLKFAIPVVPGSILSWILALSDRYILLYFVGSADVGIYGIASRFTVIVNILITSIRLAYTTFAFNNKDSEEGKKSFEKVFDFMTLGLCGICFTVSLFSFQIVTLMTTPEFQSSGLLVRDLMFSQLFYGITTIVSYGILFVKKPVYSLIANSAGAAVNICLNLLLIPTYGVAAAAFTTFVGYCVVFVLTCIFSQKLYPCNFRIVRAIVAISVFYALSYIGASLSIYIQILICILGIGFLLFLFRDNIRELLSMAKTRKDKST